MTNLSRAAALMLVVAAVGARAETFPSRPVRMLVPYAPGGAVDVLARTLGEPLSKIWGQSLVVENRPGAGGVIASQMLAQSPPDGHTLILVASGHPLNQFFYQKLPYDTFRDFAPIAEVAYSANVIVVRKDSPVRTLEDLLALARARPGELSYGMSGIGTSVHLAGELLKAMTKIDVVAVPYRGGIPAMTAVMGGDIAFSLNPMAEVVGQAQGGSVRALTVTTAQRSPVMPDVPTVAESGVPGFDVPVWWGVLGPAGMAPDLVARVNRDIRAALEDPATRDRLATLGAVAVTGTPQEFDAFMHAEARKWQPIIRAANIAVQ